MWPTHGNTTPHRQQPTRLPCSWDSQGKNTGVGCHFLLQCIRVKSESEVAQLCPTLSDPMDCSPPGSSIHGIFQARVLEWGAISRQCQMPLGGQNYPHWVTCYQDVKYFLWENGDDMEIYVNLWCINLMKWEFFNYKKMLIDATIIGKWVK